MHADVKDGKKRRLIYYRMQCSLNTKEKPEGERIPMSQEYSYTFCKLQSKKWKENQMILRARKMITFKNRCSFVTDSI